MLYFFFSSRRRHTRLTCDWSSDVCSSDLSSVNRMTAPTEPSSSMTSVVLPTDHFRPASAMRSLRISMKSNRASSSCQTEIELRSEEHTSELQSHVNLVCRLLLEKKKKKK